MSKSVHDHANLGGSNRLMSMAEAAAYIGSTKASLTTNYVRWGVPCVRGPGRRVQFRERSLNVWIAEREDDQAAAS